MTTPPTNNNHNAVTRQYRNDEDYMRDAQSMLTHGWHVIKRTRTPNNAILATYAYQPSATSSSTPPILSDAAVTSASAETTSANATTQPFTEPPVDSTASASTSASTSTSAMTQPASPAAPQGAAGAAQRFPGGTKALVSLWGVYLLTGWFLFLGVALAPKYTQTYFATMLLIMLTECAALLIWDWHNALTLFDSIQWGAMPWWERIVGGLFFVAFPTLYLLLATARHVRAVDLSPRRALGQAFRNFRVSTGWMKAGVVAASLALVITFCASSTMVMALAPALPPSASGSAGTGHTGNTLTSLAPAPAKSAPTATATRAIATVAPTATPVPPTPTPTPLPTATPRPAPTATARPLPPPPTATPRPTSPPAPQSCYPLTNSGNCYEPGEYCRTVDHNTTGIAGDGERIKCTYNNGWRWEPY